MEDLNIYLNSIIQEIQKALIELYGEKDSDFIKEKLSDTLILPVFNSKGFDEYKKKLEGKIDQCDESELRFYRLLETTLNNDKGRSEQLSYIKDKLRKCGCNVDLYHPIVSEDINKASGGLRIIPSGFKCEYLRLNYIPIDESTIGNLARRCITSILMSISVNYTTSGRYYGLEPLSDPTTTKNSDDNSYGTYHVLNTALIEMISQEVIEKLQDKGVYLLEPKSVTKLTDYDPLKDQIIKKLLQPLLSKIRLPFMNAILFSRREELIEYIGKDNFEELVDAINRIDSLLAVERNASKIKKSSNNTLPNKRVKEYKRQERRLKIIYDNIDIYRSIKEGNLLLLLLERLNETNLFDEKNQVFLSKFKECLCHLEFDPISEVEPKDFFDSVETDKKRLKEKDPYYGTAFSSLMVWAYEEIWPDVSYYRDDKFFISNTRVNFKDVPLVACVQIAIEEINKDPQNFW